MKSLVLLIFVAIMLISGRALAQTSDSTLVRIETTDGNEFFGKVVREDALIIVLSTTNLGEITIQKTSIKRREIIRQEQVKGGEVWFENPQATRYFWAPNGYGLKKGEGYYQNIYVLWNQFAVGVTDNISIGGGVVPFFLFGGPTPVFIAPKVSLPLVKNKVNLGAGALVGTVLGEESATFGIVYGLSTFGNPDQNFTIGLGYAFIDGEWASTPLINVSGMVRATKRMYFLTENYYIRGGDGGGGGIIGLGGRWLIKKASLDFMFAIPYGTDGSFIVIPAVGFVIPFGKGKV